MTEDILWKHVLVQQFEDLYSPKPIVRAQANAWFNASIGTSLSDFEEVTEYAGFEPETIRKAYDLFKHSPNPKEAFKNIRKVLLEE